MERITDATIFVITGYEVFRFGVPMIGEYVNTHKGRRVPISPAVPGAQYRITAWALGNGSRSVTPAVKSVTTGEASECRPLTLAPGQSLLLQLFCLILYSTITTKELICFKGSWGRNRTELATSY